MGLLMCFLTFKCFFFSGVLKKIYNRGFRQKSSHVQIDDSRSDKESVLFGAPQGSMGPLIISGAPRNQPARMGYPNII